MGDFLKILKIILIEFVKMIIFDYFCNRIEVEILWKG